MEQLLGSYQAAVKQGSAQACACRRSPYPTHRNLRAPVPPFPLSFLFPS